MKIGKNQPEGRLTVKMDVKLDKPKTEIAPLLLLPLVENAFKHGASEQRYTAFRKCASE